MPRPPPRGLGLSPWLALALLLALLTPAGSRHPSALVNQLLAYRRVASKWVADVLPQHPGAWPFLDGVAETAELDPPRGPPVPERGGYSGALTVPEQMLAEWRGGRHLQRKGAKAHVQEADDEGVFCEPGIAVYVDPVITCDGVPRTAAEYVALPDLNVSRCIVTGRQTCVCAKDSSRYMADECSTVRPVKCTPALVDPPLDCPPPAPADGRGDPVCFTIDRTQTVRFKYRLGCSLDGEVLTLDPNDWNTEVKLAELSPADLARVQNTPYLSVADRHYELADWYRDQFHYFLTSSDLSLAVSFPLTGQFPRHMYLKIWDFIKLSDDTHKQYKPVKTEHLVGKDVVTFDVDFVRVEDAFLVGGRAYLETGFDIHHGSHRLFVDIQNYLARHAAHPGFSPWIIVAIVLPSVSAAGCCGFLMLRLIRRRKRLKAKKAKALARAQALAKQD